MTAWGYARVSRIDQNPDLQIDALRKAGVEDEHLVVEHISGTRADRPGLTRLLAGLVTGDSLTVWRLDRLGRSTTHLLTTVRDLDARGVTFRSLSDPVDTGTAGGRLILTVFAALGEFERELLIERTMAGLQAARERGVRLGRRPSISPEQVPLIFQLESEGKSHRTIAKVVNRSPSAVGRVLRGEVTALADESARARQ